MTYVAIGWVGLILGVLFAASAQAGDAAELDQKVSRSIDRFHQEVRGAEELTKRANRNLSVLRGKPAIFSGFESHPATGRSIR